jgi:hypothetical protein
MLKSFSDSSMSFDIAMSVLFFGPCCKTNHREDGYLSGKGHGVVGYDD